MSFVNNDLQTVINMDEADDQPWNNLQHAALRMQNIWRMRDLLPTTSAWNTSKWHIHRAIETIDIWLTHEEAEMQRTGTKGALEELEIQHKKRKREETNEEEIEQKRKREETNEEEIEQDNEEHIMHLTLTPSSKKMARKSRKPPTPPSCPPPTHWENKTTNVTHWENKTTKVWTIDDNDEEEVMDGALSQKDDQWLSSPSTEQSGWKKSNWKKDAAPWKAISTEKKTSRPVGENKTSFNAYYHADPYSHGGTILLGDENNFLVAALLHPTLAHAQYEFVRKWAQGPFWDSQNKFAHGYRLHLRDLPNSWTSYDVVEQLHEDATRLTGTKFLGPMHSWCALPPSESTVQSILTFNTATEAAVAFQACWKWNHTFTGNLAHVNVSWCAYAKV